MKQFYPKLQKALFLIAFFTLFFTLSKAQTLTLGSVDAGPYTPGSTIAVPFTTSGNCIKPDNVFELYISSVPGGVPDTEIGSYNGFYANFVNGIIPSGLTPGSYNLAIKSTMDAATSTTATINISAGSPVEAKLTSSLPLLNSNYPDVFGNCSGNGTTYNFTNSSTGNATVTTDVFDEINQTDIGPLTFNASQNASFNAAKVNYTIFVKAVSGGTVGTKAYQLINNRLSTNFGTTSGDPVCLINGQGVLMYTILPAAIQNNYPGNIYRVDWGDGTFSQYTLCDLLLSNGQLSHAYVRTSCGTSSGGQINSFPVNAQASSNICGTLGSPLTSYAKVVSQPVNSFNGPQSACLNVPVTYGNASDPGQDASNNAANCQNNNALYTWIIDIGTPNETQFSGYALTTPFTYTFTTSGHHTVTLRYESQSNTVCSAADLTKDVCVLAPPLPDFNLTSSVICSNSSIIPNDQSVTDNSCNSIPANNLYTWSVTGPAGVSYLNSTTVNSHQPEIKFVTPGVYTLTLSIGTESCGNVSTSQTITVNASPTVTLSPNYSVCGNGKTLTFANNAGATQVIFTGTTTDQPNTYNWTVSGGNYHFVNGTTAASKYPQILFDDFGVYTITATQTNNCGTDIKSQQIDFKQSPNISAGPDQTVCPDVSVQLAGTITGPAPQSFQWVGGNGTFSPNQNTLNAIYTPSNAEIGGQVHLTLVVQTGNPSPCDQLEDEVIITINPRNGVTSSSATSICTGNAVAYHPTAQQTGSTFSWTSTVTSGNISNNTNGSGSDITDVLTNNDPVNNGTVTYTITPTSNGCPGTSFQLTVTVTPRPIISINSTTNTICSGQGAGITFTSNLSGTTFKWTTTATSNVYGNNSQTAGNFTGINEVLTNTSATTQGTVTYTIIPISASGCEGTPVIVTISVQPLPVQANAGPDQQLCSASTTTLSGNPPGVSTGFWSLRSGQTGITFADATQPNTTVSGLQPGITYTFRWTITGAAQCTPTFDEVDVNNLSPLTNIISFGSSAVCYGQTITIIGTQPSGGTGTYVYSWESSTDNVNWTTSSGQSGRDYTFTGTQNISIRRIVTSGPCSSMSLPISIMVQPAIGNNTITANQSICYNTAPAQLSGSTPTGADNNYTYQWQSSTDNGTSWFAISGSNTQNYQPTALTASTQFRRVVTSALCSGAQQNISNPVTITVAPQNNNMLTSAANLAICTGATLNYQPTAQQAGTVFTWVSSATSNISGNSASGTGNITDQLINSDQNSNGTVTYIITPNNNGCPGASFTLQILVTPVPRVIITHSGDQICSGNPTGITFTTNVPGVMLKWTSDNVPGIYSNNNQVTPVIATRIDDVLQSGITTPATIVYHITPVSPGGCEGPTVDASVTVLPIPVTANAGADAQLCNAVTYTLNGNNPAPSAGKWTVTSGQATVVFSNDTQSNATVSGLLPGQIYTFRWTITSTGGCSVSTDDVTISDFSEIINTISFNSPAVCYGQTVTISGNQPTGGTGSFVYTWESSTDGNNWTTITGESSRFYTFTATQNIYLRRIVSSGPCIKISNVIQLFVQPPIANNTITADQTICYNNTPVLLSGSTPTGGDGNFNYQWQSSNDNGASWNSINGANTINYQPVALLMTMQFRRIVTTGLCVNDQQNISNLVTITVTPQNSNAVTSANSVAICTGNSVAYHPTAQAAGTVFTWVSSASASVTGNSASGTGDINDALTNADPTANGTVTYTITPVNNNCPGVPFTLIVNVTPRPILSVNTTANTICSGQPTGITFSSNLSGTTFKWTSNASAGIYGNNQQQPVFASRIDDVLTNTSATNSGTATYVITPVGPSGCEGAPITIIITVQPAAVQANAGPDEQICSATNYVLKGNDPGIAAGRWTVTSGQTVIFADATKYNTTVSGLLPRQQYTFRWTITGAAQCTATFDDVVITDLESVTNTISFAGPVCYSQTVTIAGDQATGGTGSFVYAWEISADNNTWTVVTGQTGRNYTFNGTQTVYVRRTVTSGPCTSVSAPVLVVVQPAISNNSVSADQQVCYNNAPEMMTGSVPAGADGHYVYQWQSSTDNGATWTNISGASLQDYQAGNLTVGTWFRRVVSSTLCTGPQQSISNVIKMTVNPVPVAAYTFSKDLACIPFAITAANIKATASDANSAYNWYADGTLIGTGINFPGYTITTDDTHVEIKLVASSKYGCADAVFTHVFSTIKEVKAGFAQNQTKGCGPLTVTFSNTSDPQNLATYSWDFGNGTTSTQASPNPVTYAARTDGKDTTYTITLKAMTTCGIRTATSTVLVRPKPVSIFTPDKTTGCSPLTVNFNNTSPGTGNTYTYDFGDGTTQVITDNRAVNHTYIAPNNKVFTVKMTAQNECGISTTQYNISIAPNTVLPQLIVDGDQKAGCAPWTVQFHNNTKGGTYFTYDFGDGTTLSSVSAPEVVSHTFLKDGIYKVVMKATNGCSDTSASQSITVYPQPLVGFAADITKGCTQLTVNFINKTNGNNTYLWDFGDGSTSNMANPTHTFQARSTPYTISLIARNLLGCPDTAIMKNYISVVFPPKAAFRANPDSVIVYPHYSFSFKDQSDNLPILWKWGFGDGSTSTKQNPEHTYRDTGVYKVNLVVYNVQGCADTITHKVQITGVPGQLFVPNAFMPNSKFEELRTFKIKGSGIKNWRMRVFNKWGQVIWESTKLTSRGEPVEGWDGMMNGAPAPQGVYFWQVDATYLNGGQWEGMSYHGSTPSRTGVIHLIQ